MESIVETVRPCVSGCQVIPTVGDAYFVAVQQVELESNVGADAREQDVVCFITAEDGVGQGEVGSIVVHEGKSGAGNKATERYNQLAVCGQQVV